MAYTSRNGAQGFSGGEVFICTECGEGFRHYQKLVEHMAIHGLFFPDPLSINGGNNTNTHIEFALHENGTLTVVDRSVLSKFSFLFGKPSAKPSWCQTPTQAALTLSKMEVKESAKFRCERCGQGFRSQKCLQLHQQYRVLEQGFKCTLCCKVLNDKESLQSHLQNHAHERFYSCGHCGIRFLRRETLLSHQKQCRGSSGSKALIRLQDQENSMEKSYPCKICHLRFFWLSDLQSHLNSHLRINKQSSHATQPQEVQGDEEREKNGMPELNNHQTSQHPEVNKEDFSSSAKNKMHQMPAKKQMQQGSPITPRMRSRQRGRNHAKIYSCKQCPQGFVHSSSLSRHMRYHKGTLHACVHCGRRFPQRCAVTKHLAMNHCSVLKMKMASKANESSQTLMQTTGEKDSKQKELHEEDQHSSNVDNELSLDQGKGFLNPRMKYKCKDCCRVFGLLSVYKRHVIYHKQDPCKVLLSCPHCPSRFTFQTALDRHIENHIENFKQDGTKHSSNNVDDPGNQHKDTDAGEPNTNANDSVPSKVLDNSSDCS
nr:zinc finger protein 99 [Misgurnus anguillicaudatus]XP_055065978.1 zinc finger protein 99 [Misgurnus anguillicaudatus]